MSLKEIQLKGKIPIMSAFIQNSKMNIFDTSGQCTVSP